MACTCWASPAAGAAPPASMDLFNAPSREAALEIEPWLTRDDFRRSKRLREAERDNYAFFLDLPERDRAALGHLDLFFANAGAFREQIRRLTREQRPRWVVLQCEAMTDIAKTMRPWLAERFVIGRPEVVEALKPVGGAVMTLAGVSLAQESVEFLDQRRNAGLFVHRLVGQGAELAAQCRDHPAGHAAGPMLAWLRGHCHWPAARRANRAALTAPTDRA